MMRSDDLIEGLVDDLRPIAPRGSLWQRVVQWLTWALLSGSLLALVLGLRSDLQSAVTSLEMWISVAALVVICVVSVVVAMQLSIPQASRPRYIYLIPLIGLSVWGLLVAASGLALGAWGDGSFTYKCARDILFFSAFPGWMLYRLVTRNYPTSSNWSAVAVTVASASVGAIGAHFVCANDGPVHVLLWHGLPVLALLGTMLIFARFLFRPYSG